MVSSDTRLQTVKDKCIQLHLNILPTYPKWITRITSVSFTQSFFHCFTKLQLQRNIFHSQTSPKEKLQDSFLLYYNEQP